MPGGADRKRANAITEASTDRAEYNRRRAVGREHRARSGEREAQLAREVKHQEWEYHHSGAVDQVRCEEEPNLSRQSTKPAPRIQSRIGQRKRPPLRWPYRFSDCRLSCQAHSAPCRNRTCNLMIKSHLLCQLS